VRPRNPRWLVLIGLYLLFGLLGAWYLSGTTIPGNDLATYQRAGDALWTSGDPYSVGAGLGQEAQYRYPPLLAMLMPILGWPPLWFALVALAPIVPIFFWYRDQGLAGLLVPALLVGAWIQQLLNGNSQAIVIALLVVVPRWRSAGPLLLALATMIKLHPALALFWFIGRRDWRAVGIFLVAIAVLLLVQAPWLGAFVDFYLTDAAATATIPGMSLRALGIPIWVAGIVVMTLISIRLAGTRYGWLLATVLQLVALPRILLVNLALLLAAPLPPRGAERATAQARRQARPAMPE
jgi:hypothetical protein